MSKSFRDLLQGDLKVTNLKRKNTDILGKKKVHCTMIHP